MAALGLLVSGAVILLLLRQVDVASSLRVLTSVSPWLPSALVAIYLSTFVLRARRWQWLLEGQAVPFRASLDAVVLGYAGNNVLPARGGELVRMEVISRSVPGLSRVTALTSLAAERILDGATLLMVLGVCILAAGDAAIGQVWLLRLLALVALIFVGAGVTLCALRSFERSIMFRLGRSAHRPVRALGALAAKGFRALAFLGWNRTTLLVLLYGCAIWALEALVFVLALAGMGFEGPRLLMGFTALAVVNFGILIPSGPGYVGVFEAMTVLALAPFHIGEDRALAAALLIHACQFLPLVGWGLLLIMQRAMLRPGRAS
jgi:uncharacterized protein (TIRG00374 family)